MKKTLISKRRWLLVPVETKARELTAKLLLACVAAERGWGTVLGEKKTVRGKQNRLPRGAFIEKSISPGRIVDIKRAHSYGNRVTAWCEEGLIYLNREDYSQGRLEQQSYDAIDYFFAWGKHQADDISGSLGGDHKKIILSGNPRFDLLRPELRGIFNKAASDIKRRYGRIILVNTKFSIVNNNRNIKDFDYVSFLHSIGKIKTKEKEELIRRWVNLNKRLFIHFQELLPLLSENFKNHLIVIRPHPSESHAPWIEKAKNLPNVEVIFEGNVSEWLLAADIMIHNNCTTGVEAFLLERPSISYRPLKDEAVEHELPDKVSFQAQNKDELIDYVNRFIRNRNGIFKEEREGQKALAHKYIANVEGKLASDIITATLDRLDLPLLEGRFPLQESLINILKNKTKSLTQRIKKQYKNSDSCVDHAFYYKQKFPGIRLEEMEFNLDELRNTTGRFADIKITTVDSNTFCVYR